MVGRRSHCALFGDTASASGLLGPPIKASNADLKKVPNNGSIDAYAAGRTQLILDISGLFAP